MINSNFNFGFGISVKNVNGEDVTQLSSNENCNSSSKNVKLFKRKLTVRRLQAKQGL